MPHRVMHLFFFLSTSGSYEDKHNFNLISENKTDFCISLVTCMIDKKKSLTNPNSLHPTPAVICL